MNVQACALTRHLRSLRTSGWQIGLIISIGLTLCKGQAEVGTNELRTAAAVRGLTVQEAEQHQRVHLRGVVTFFHEGFFSRFVQDDTAGIYLNAWTNMPVLSAGQLVEVEGVTGAGEFAPVVTPEEVTVLGEAPLPLAQQASIEELMGGQKDSQFVEVRGIVRSAQLQGNEGAQLFVLELASGSSRLSIYSRQLPVRRPEDMLASTVRARGVCCTKFNRRRQLFAVRVMVPRPEDLVIEKPGPQEPFAVAARPIDSLLQFRPHEFYNHRVKVAGTVICFEPARRVFLQDRNLGIEVQIQGGEPLEPGDRVEALGFVSRGDYTPMLQDAIYRKLSSGAPLPPAEVTPDQALKGNYDCRLIRITARLLDWTVHGTESCLILQQDGYVFQACLSQVVPAEPFIDFPNGGRLTVTGICLIEPGEWLAGEDWRAKSFRVELQSLKDVQVVELPPWWTLRRAFCIAGIVGGAALAAFSWVGLLHRQVAERTRELEVQIQERQRAERERLVEQERARVAQDLHDDLGAALTEVSMLGAMARTPSLPQSERDRYLEKLTSAVRLMVAALDEIVWAVNPKYDSIASLASYYSLFAQRFLNLAGIGCRLDVADSFPEIPLDSRSRHYVFLCFKEALNNAVRHSGASQVQIQMATIDHQLRIAVADNGQGFMPAQLPPGSDGLTNIKARMTKLGGRCDIASQPGQGTTVEFRLPLKEPVP